MRVPIVAGRPLETPACPGRGADDTHQVREPAPSPYPDWDFDEEG